MFSPVRRGGLSTSPLMAAHSQEAGLRPIDWTRQIRAELHEPINGCDSSGAGGGKNLLSNRNACFATHFILFYSFFRLLPFLFGSAMMIVIIYMPRIPDRGIVHCASVLCLTIDVIFSLLRWYSKP